MFSKSVLQLVKAMKAVHLDSSTSGSLGIPLPSLETLTLAEAINSEDALEWLDSFKDEISSLVKINTFKIIWEESLMARSLSLADGCLGES